MAATRYVYVCLEDLRFWRTSEDLVIDGRCAYGDSVRQQDADRTRIYFRLTRARWARLRAIWPPESLTAIRAALIDLYGPAVVERLAA